MMDIVIRKERGILPRAKATGLPAAICVMLVDAKYRGKQINASSILTMILNEFSAITEYRTLQNSLPRRLAALLQCRCILFYQRIADTLQFVAGSFDDIPGWSSALLRFAHINPVDLHSEVLEACAWRERTVVVTPPIFPTFVAAPLIYRQRAIGVLVAIRNGDGARHYIPTCWTADEVAVLEAVAGVVALLLENTRLLERDRERIHELSLLNSISSQLNSSIYERCRMRTIVLQRTREIAAVDLCELLEPGPACTSDEAAWIRSELREKLFQHFHEQRSFSPLIIERQGDPPYPFMQECLTLLPPGIKTFFALPLLNGRGIARHCGSLLHGSLETASRLSRKPEILGIIVGGYYHPWKLRRAEIVLLEVLASQASSVLDNVSLVGEVLQARDEARKLLRQVLDDERLKALILESIPSGLVTVDHNGNVVMFNRAATAILGYHAYEVIGQPLHKFLDIRLFSMPSTTSEGILETAFSQKKGEHIAQHTRKVQGGMLIVPDRQGREVILDVTLLPLCDDQGACVGTLVTFTDVTSVHRLEEEKRRLDRLASLGEMAANVAHEVRNPLASIKTSMQMLMDDMASDGGKPLAEREDESFNWARDSISVVLKEVERLDSIVRDLLLFAKPRQLHRVKCNIAQLNDRVLQFIQPRCEEFHVAVHRVYCKVPAIWVDEGQIEQVLLNIYMNALQAMPDGGTLTISCHVLTEDYASQSAEVDQYAYSTASHCDRCKTGAPSWLEISVSDTGPGIPPEQLERIFQPFFTTRAHGIGLGLAITRRLVEDHGGYIRAEGRSGCGATLSVRLPLITESGAHGDGSE